VKGKNRERQWKGKGWGSGGVGGGGVEGGGGGGGGQGLYQKFGFFSPKNNQINQVYIETLIFHNFFSSILFEFFCEKHFMGDNKVLKSWFGVTFHSSFA